MDGVADFLSGLRLNAEFYAEVVGPLLAGVPHSAARLGWGSDVLGFDDVRSTDHGWGPQLVVFVGAEWLEKVSRTIDDGLPEAFRGWPVRYGWDDTLVSHHVAVTEPSTWLIGQLGVDATAELTTTDWLLLSQQKVLEVTAGVVYRDDTGQLGRVRDMLAWYPEPVWLWMLACQWTRVSQEEAFVGRTAEVGDELGSRLVAGRLAREVMRLWFLMARTYWPYTKWFGTTFSRLADAAPLGRVLGAAVAADNYPDREEALVAAYGLVGRRHNDLGLTQPVDAEVRPFHSRPFRVLMAERFSQACLDRIHDPHLLSLPLIGSADQVADSTDLLSHGQRPRQLVGLYAPDAAPQPAPRHR